MVARAHDLALLRRYEPIVCFTAGELFFPAPVEPYVRHSSLRVYAPERGPGMEIVPAGALDLDRLAAEGAADPSRTLCLQFVAQPLRGTDYHRWLARPDRPAFKTTGRLARVGLFPRFIDALVQLSLYARGTVPGGTAAAAERAYRAIAEVAPGPVYYGRVVRQGGYTILHYLFFYVMNDWRSSFQGVNDHEADWEQVLVYLTEGADRAPDAAVPLPAWVAYASHDYAGDDLRRRWDDPELHKVGTHPVVYAGAGSHASYFKPGEYLTSVRLHFLEPVMRVIHVLRRIWQDVLRQGPGDEILETAAKALSIPFVDYARGDGLVVGPSWPPGRTPAPGGRHGWTAVLLDETAGWVDAYRGLWGLHTRDPLSGEQAPSGPKYNRDGSVRQSWHDPLGWAGLGKVAPEPHTGQVLAERIAELEAELVALDQQVAALEVELGQQDLEVRALRRASYLRPIHRDRERWLSEREAERNALRRRRVEIAESLAACRRELARRQAGDPGDPRAHLHHTHEPQSPLEIKQSRIAQIWAGISISMLLLGGVVVTVFELGNWATALLLVIGAVVLIENILHRAVTRLLLNATMVLALVCTLVLVYEYFRALSLLMIVGLAIFILADNIRELRRM